MLAIKALVNVMLAMRVLVLLVIRILVHSIGRSSSSAQDEDGKLDLPGGKELNVYKTKYFINYCM